MKHLLLDLNVVLDVILKREPHVAAARAVWKAVELGQVRGFLPAHGVTTIDYLLAKELGSARSQRILADVLSVLKVAAVDETVIRRALDLESGDFEDAVCAACAEAVGCDVIVTRDGDGFGESPVPWIDPATAVAWLAQAESGQAS